MVYEGGGGVEKVQKTVYVVYERPLSICKGFLYNVTALNNIYDSVDFEDSKFLQ